MLSGNIAKVGRTERSKPAADGPPFPTEVRRRGLYARTHGEGSGSLRPLNRCATALPKGEPLATPGWKARRFWCLHSREDASAAVLTKSAGFCDTGGGQRPPLQSKKRNNRSKIADIGRTEYKHMRQRSEGSGSSHPSVNPRLTSSLKMGRVFLRKTGA